MTIRSSYFQFLGGNETFTSVQRIRSGNNVVTKARLFVAVLLCCVGTAALSSDWPERTIKLIVLFPAGGSADSVARPLAQKLADTQAMNGNWI